MKPRARSISVTIHEDYPEAMRWLAAKENVPLIDLNEMTRTPYEALGTETSKRAFVHHPAGTYPDRPKFLRITPTSIHTEPINSPMCD